MKPPVCPACGARLSEGATHCDLCGHDLAAPVPDASRSDDVPVSPDPVANPTPSTPSAPVIGAADSESGPFCTHCGTRNPAYARFCYQCGHALHGIADSAPTRVASAIPASPPPRPQTATRPDSDAGRRAFALLGAGVLAVLVLFFITRASKTEGPAAPPAVDAAAPTPAAPAPLPDDVAARAATLEDEIAALSGEERLAKQEELVRLYAQSGAFPQAARLQNEVAEARQTALAWADAGSFYLAAMLRMQGPERATLAQQSAAAYERSVELDPADLDVKTDLATAYLNDGQNPMLAVQTVKDVLAEAPEHVRANFNYGLMLAQINRTDQAIEQFDKVVELTDPDDPVHQRAEQERARLRASAVGTASG